MHTSSLIRSELRSALKQRWYMYYFHLGIFTFINYHTFTFSEPIILHLVVIKLFLCTVFWSFSWPSSAFTVYYGLDCFKPLSLLFAIVGYFRTINSSESRFNYRPCRNFRLLVIDIPDLRYDQLRWNYFRCWHLVCIFTTQSWVNFVLIPHISVSHVWSDYESCIIVRSRESFVRSLTFLSSLPRHCTVSYQILRGYLWKIIRLQ